jgi:hypothetical protein
VTVEESDADRLPTLSLSLASLGPSSSNGDVGNYAYIAPKRSRQALLVSTSIVDLCAWYEAHETMLVLLALLFRLRLSQTKYTCC